MGKLDGVGFFHRVGQFDSVGFGWSVLLAVDAVARHFDCVGFVDSLGQFHGLG
jgi:hypothetical protein